MKNTVRRSLVLILVIAMFFAGMGILLAQFIIKGPDWVTNKADNQVLKYTLKDGESLIFIYTNTKKIYYPKPYTHGTTLHSRYCGRYKRNSRCPFCESKREKHYCMYPQNISARQVDASKHLRLSGIRWQSTL